MKFINFVVKKHSRSIYPSTREFNAPPIETLMPQRLQVKNVKNFNRGRSIEEKSLPILMLQDGFVLPHSKIRTWNIYDELRDLWECGQTLSWVFDISPQSN